MTYARDAKDVPVWQYCARLAIVGQSGSGKSWKCRFIGKLASMGEILVEVTKPAFIDLCAEHNTVILTEADEAFRTPGRACARESRSAGPAARAARRSRSSTAWPMTSRWCRAPGVVVVLREPLFQVAERAEGAAGESTEAGEDAPEHAVVRRMRDALRQFESVGDHAEQTPEDCRSRPPDGRMERLRPRGR